MGAMPSVKSLYAMSTTRGNPVAASAGFTIEKVVVEAEGLCPSCAGAAA